MKILRWGGPAVVDSVSDGRPSIVAVPNADAGDVTGPPASPPVTAFPPAPRLRRPRQRPVYELSRSRRFRRLVKLASVIAYDTGRYLRHSTAVLPPRTAEAIDPYVVMGYHAVEKGMALPKPRPGFGQEVVSRLLVDVERVEAETGGHPSVDAARRALRQYRSDIADEGFRNDPALVEFVERLGDGLGGTRSVSRAEIHAAAKIDLADFFGSRHSVRNFAPGEVSVAAIEEAVGMARKTPSVCNRQSGRVHAVLESELVARVLEVQNGNAGFRDTVPAVLVITTDLQKFVSCAERYQGWIDGGLFAMSLCYALHSTGLGTCMLNWSAEVSQDRKLRRVLDIPDSENVVMLMAVGHLPDAFNVAASPRRSISNLLTVHSLCGPAR